MARWKPWNPFTGGAQAGASRRISPPPDIEGPGTFAPDTSVMVGFLRSRDRTHLDPLEENRR